MKTRPSPHSKPPQGSLPRSEPGNARARPKPRSDEQRLGSALFTLVMMAWEDLTDEERLSWNTHGNSKRTHGINCFKSVNLRRLRRGEGLTRVLPSPKPLDVGPVLKRLVIRNRAQRITLELELHRVPTDARTVWAALPCNKGLAKPDKCPRISGLPAAKRNRCDITAPYFHKHGQRIWERRLPMVGKRIFVRLRREMDEGVNLYEEVSAVVPPEEGRSKHGKSPFPFEAPS